MAYSLLGEMRQVRRHSPRSVPSERISPTWPSALLWAGPRTSILQKVHFVHSTATPGDIVAAEVRERGSVAKPASEKSTPHAEVRRRHGLVAGAAPIGGGVLARHSPGHVQWPGGVGCKAVSPVPRGRNGADGCFRRGGGVSVVATIGGLAHAELRQAAADDVGDDCECREAPAVFSGQAVGVKVGGE